MASEESTSRLDPDLLDEIIRELDLEESTAIDRLNSLLADLGDRFWNWLKSASGGEDGWLSRLDNWLREILSIPQADDTSVDFSPVMTVLSWLPVALLVALVGYVAYWLWAVYRPRRLQASNLVYQRLREQASVPVDTLTADKQPAALFARVCLALADTGRLQIQPDSTHETLAEAAQVTDVERTALGQLARAADRGLFGGWRPHAQEIAELAGLTERFSNLQSFVHAGDKQ